MATFSIPGWTRTFLVRQLFCLMIAIGAAGILWALMGHAPSIPVTLIYSFALGNSTALLLESVRLPARWRAASWSWLIYIVLLLVTTPFAVALATAIVFFLVPPAMVPPAPRTSLWAFLLTAWKFPSVANLIFGLGYLAYFRTRCRLESRNRQLQETLESSLAERQVNDAELQQARDIQRGLLPKEIPQVPGFYVTGAWEPAKVVGGDYYDVIRLSRDKLAICIADVAGKGISAALLMANVQAAVRAFASERAAPSKVCAQINSVLYTNTAPEKFVTLFYGILDARKCTLEYANAGHLHPIVLRRNGETVHLDYSGALLGVFSDWPYEDGAAQLQSGDVLLLFTDGITEAQSPNGEEFGEARLVTAVAESFWHSPATLPAQLFRKIDQFCDSRVSDDRTLIVVAAGVTVETEDRTSINAQALQPAGANL